MKLNRRFARSIKHELSFYISIVVIITITLLLYYLFNIGGKAIIEFGETFFESQNLEDAHFTTYLPISEDEISRLEDEYNATLEAMRYTEIETDGVAARVFKKTEKIDLYDITLGRDVQSDDEMIISQGFFDASGMALGDTLTIGDKDYSVVGTFLRPDYLYMLKNEGDSYKNVSTFYLAYMTDEAFEALGDASLNYLVVYGEDNENEFRRHVNDTYVFSGYSSAKGNERILLVTEQAEMFIVMSYIMLVVMPLFSALLISIVISRKVKGEQRLIGILYSLGYKKRQLMGHYLGYAVIPAVIAGIAMTLISSFGAEGLAKLCLQDYEPMPLQARLDPFVIALGLVIPPVICALAALLSLNSLLKKDPVVLLRGEEEGRKRFRGIFRKSNIGFKVKFVFRSLLANPGRSLVVVIGIFLGDMIFLFGLGLLNSVDVMSSSAAEQLGNYEYLYTLNTLMDENIYGGEAIFAYSLEDEDGGNVSLIGCEEDDTYLNLTTNDGGAANVEDGYYITNLLAIANDWQEGSSVTLVNPFTAEETKIKIAGVIANNAQKAVYTSAEKACLLAGLDKTLYNAVLGDVKLDIPDDRIITWTSMKDIADQADTLMTQIEPFFIIFLVLGAILCFFAIYTAVNMVVRENRKTISMLKILGYRDLKIDGIVLGIYVIFLPAAFLLSIAAVYGLMNIFFLWATEYGIMLIDSVIRPESFVETFALSAIVYLGSMFLLSGKIKRADMVKVLKSTDE